MGYDPQLSKEQWLFILQKYEKSLEKELKVFNYILNRGGKSNCADIREDLKLPSNVSSWKPLVTKIKKHYEKLPELPSRERGSGDSLVHELVPFEDYFPHKDQQYEQTTKTKSGYSFVLALRKPLQEALKEFTVRSNDKKPYVTATEGVKTQGIRNEYGRDRKLRDRVAKRDNYTCQICHIPMSKTYGEIANQAIHIHHKTLLSSFDEPTETKEEDLIAVCPNCHYVLHYCGKRLLTVEKLKEHISIKLQNNVLEEIKAIATENGSPTKPYRL